MNIKNLLDNKGRECQTIHPDDSMAEAIKIMINNHIGSLVVTEDNSPIAIITERDVMFTLHHRGCEFSSIPVKDVMGSKLVTCNISDTIHDAMTLMFENETGRRIRHLPVIDDDNKLIGMVSNGDLLARLKEEVEFENKVMKNYIKNWPEENI